MSDVSITDLIAEAWRNLSNVTNNPVHSIDLDLYGDVLAALESVTAPTTPDPFSQSPHMASKYWAELVRARKRIAELEAAVTAPTEPEWACETCGGFWPANDGNPNMGKYDRCTFCGDDSWESVKEVPQ